MNLRKTNGVTLVALIITVILLLIISGISITGTLRGHEETEEASEISELNMIQHAILERYTKAQLTKETLPGTDIKKEQVQNIIDEIKSKSNEQIFLKGKEGYKRLLYDATRLNINKLEAISDPVQGNTRGEQISFVFPILRYHSRWSELGEEDFIKEKGKYEYIFKGQWVVKGIKAYDGKKLDKFQNLNEDEVKDFEKITRYCKDNNVELLAVEFPSIQTWNNDKKEKVKQIAKNNDVKFIDLHDVLNEIGFDWTRDTEDGGNHLNYRRGRKNK